MSEEHDKQAEDITNAISASLTRPEVFSLPDEQVHARDITIWVDPLDATQEYTGRFYDLST